MTQLPNDLTLSQGLIIVCVWSVLAIGGGAWIGVSCSAVDCGTCEAALEDSIDELHACQRQLLTRPISACDDERQAERDHCQQTLAEYKRLRCRICEATHDTYPPKSADNPHPTP